VTGCYTELDEEKIRDIDPSVEIFKNHEKDRIINRISPKTKKLTLNPGGRARPFVKIQEGCSHRCSYCIIPALRGRPKSRTVEDIVEEVLMYEQAGYDEVVLTGIHIGLYGIDLKRKTNLTGLLESVLKKTSRVRLRLSSLEVIEIDEEFLEVFSDARVCKHLHIPLQSGSESVLKRMKRPYNTMRYERVVKEIHKRFSNISLGTDIIVGFPGETDKEFEETLRFIEGVPINYMHIFPYSDRPGTEASLMGNKVPASIKKQRAKRLRRLDKSRREKYIEAQIGKTLEVLAETVAEEGLIKGKSENYLDVFFEDTEFRPGKIYKVKILGYSEKGLKGKAFKKDKTL
ncbi:MAG: MiaB/RimO family radical SAM methylthiotransferase, partial [Nitrospirae bacterium]